MRNWILLALIATLVIVPVSSATAPSSYLTNALAPSGAQKTTIGPFTGVTITYNNTDSSPLFVFVYLDLVNSAGQTVYVQASSGNISSHGTVQFFLPISGPASGTYLATLFATTNSGVPVSNGDTISVVLPWDDKA